jgi:rhodanese-related sulfurtransferase
MDQFAEFATNHALLTAGFFAVLGILIFTELKRLSQGLNEVTPMQAVAWINDPNAVVVDVSSVSDYNKGHIVNARNITQSRINDPDAEVQKLKDSKVLVVCKTGQVAMQAAANLKKTGVAEVAVLKGGMIQWMNDQYPVTKKS